MPALIDAAASAAAECIALLISQWQKRIVSITETAGSRPVAPYRR
ncbi:hypothetical protein [Rhodococcus sp. MS16]|nr:hypothetical protein [Rhodococcus sp. MS16]